MGTRVGGRKGSSPHPSPLPAPHASQRRRGFLMHPDARGCGGDTPEPTQIRRHPVWLPDHGRGAVAHSGARTHIPAGLGSAQ